MEVLFQIGAGVSLILGFIPGAAYEGNIIKAHTQVQEVLLSGWCGSKLIVANHTKQVYLTSVVIAI